MGVTIDKLQFQPNWCRITACHAILLIGYNAKNGNPLRAWHFDESWIWYTTFFLSSHVRTGFYIIAMLCELSQHWLHREVLCPIISDKCPFPSTELTEMVSLNLSPKSIKLFIQTPSMAKLGTTGMSCIISYRCHLRHKLSISRNIPVHTAAAIGAELCRCDNE